MTGGVVFMLPRSFPALRATERDSGVVNIIANEIPRVLTGPLEPSGLTMATATGAKSNRSDYRIKCVLEIRWIANSSHCSEPSERDGRARPKQLVSATDEGGASRQA